jgi:putative membrane protein
MKKKFLKLSVFSAIALTPAVLMARPFDCPFYGRPFFGGGMFMIITTVIIIGLIIFLLVQLSRNRNLAGTFLNPGSENALEILNKRLAKGEINEEEYDKLKSKIGG